MKKRKISLSFIITILVVGLVTLFLLWSTFYFFSLYVESMKQVLERRIKRLDDKKFGEVPDLILLDGGTQQLHAVRQLFDLTGVKIKVFGMVKDSRHRTRAITSDDGEIMLSGEAFRLVTEIQDEVHRFAISYHRKKRTQKMLKG